MCLLRVLRPYIGEDPKCRESGHLAADTTKSCRSLHSSQTGLAGSSNFLTVGPLVGCSQMCRVFLSLPPSNASCSSCSVSSGTSRRSPEDSLTRCEDGSDGTTHRVDEEFPCGPILMDDPQPRRPAGHRQDFLTARNDREGEIPGSRIPCGTRVRVSLGVVLGCAHHTCG